MALLIEARPRRDQQSATDCCAGFGSAREGGHQPVRWRPRRRRQRDAQTSGPNSRARARRGRIAMSEVLDNLLANGPHQGDKLISDRSSVTGSPACAVEFNRLAEWVVPVRAGTAIPGFQDRCLKLLGHPSFFGCQRLGRGVRLGKAPIPPGTGSSRRQMPRSGFRLFNRTRKPAGSNTAARGLPWSVRGIRWRQCRGCA
jgi:hypothetical protein